MNQTGTTTHLLAQARRQCVAVLWSCAATAVGFVDYSSLPLNYFFFYVCISINKVRGDGGAIPARFCFFYGRRRLYHDAGDLILPSGSRLARPISLLHLIRLTLVFDPGFFLYFHFLGITSVLLECSTPVHDPGVIITYIASLNNRGHVFNLALWELDLLSVLAPARQNRSFHLVFLNLHIFLLSVLH